jgi:hypothetical protein
VALGEKLVFDNGFIGKHKTFRQLLDEYLQDQTPWGDFGIDLVLGMPADKIASTENYMFLPFELYKAFNHASISNRRRSEPFVVRNQMLINSINIQQQRFSVTPLLLFAGIFILVLFLTLFEVKFHLNLRLMDTIVFSLIGLSGLILALLWFATDHIATKDNLNILWAFPTHLTVPFLVYSRKPMKFPAYYFLFWSIFLTLFLIGWNYMPQQFNQAIIPIVLLLILRSYRRYQIIKRTLKQNVERRK